MLATRKSTIPTTAELAGRWNIDPAHSSVEFSAKHMMITTVSGRFGEFEGAFTIGDDPARSSTEVSIKTASISTNNPDRDAHLKSGDFLEVETYPDMKFRSTAVDLLSEADGTFRIAGELTIKDVTLPVVLEGSFQGYVPSDLFGSTRVAFSASTRINRRDFGLKWNRALETGGFLVGDDVKIRLEITGVKEQATA
jgi:polyisoprenoid-binding protein YceI